MSDVRAEATGPHSYAAAAGRDLIIYRLEGEGDLGDVVARARSRSLEGGSTVGQPAAAGDAERLGVHPAAQLDRHPSLPPFIPRQVCSRIRETMRRLSSDPAKSLFLTLSGRSCTGKTRALFEVMIDPSTGISAWPIVAPRSRSELKKCLRDGLPPRHILWLDEMQRFLDHTLDSRQIAEALTDLLCADPEHLGGPIAVLATIWPQNLNAITSSPVGDASGAAAAAHANARLLLELEASVVIVVPDDFDAADEQQARDLAATDPRLSLAHGTAGKPHRLTQVLAGGPGLVDRLYPNDASDRHVLTPFTAEARAILVAAGDLHRIGWPDLPMPRSVLRGAAEGYLPAGQIAGWFDRGLAEVTASAIVDAAGALDHFRQGIPALTPLEDGNVFRVHDYLLQDHRERSTGRPTPPQLWSAIVIELEEHPGQWSSEDFWLIPHKAAARGLYSTASKMGQIAWSWDYFEALEELGTHEALCELLTRSEVVDDQEFRPIPAGLLTTQGLEELVGRFRAARPGMARIIEEILTRRDTDPVRQSLAKLIGEAEPACKFSNTPADGDPIASLRWAKSILSLGSDNQIRGLAQHALLAKDWVCFSEYAKYIARSGSYQQVRELMSVAADYRDTGRAVMIHALYSGDADEIGIALRFCDRRSDEFPKQQFAARMALTGDFRGIDLEIPSDFPEFARIRAAQLVNQGSRSSYEAVLDLISDDGLRLMAGEPGVDEELWTCSSDVEILALIAAPTIAAEQLAVMEREYEGPREGVDTGQDALPDMPNTEERSPRWDGASVLAGTALAALSRGASSPAVRTDITEFFWETYIYVLGRIGSEEAIAVLKDLVLHGEPGSARALCFAHRVNMPGRRLRGLLPTGEPDWETHRSSR